MDENKNSKIETTIKTMLYKQAYCATKIIFGQYIEIDI